MKKRSLLIILATTLSLTLIGNSVWAGSAQRNRMKGIAIGLGAAIIGSAILTHHKEHTYRPQEQRHDKSPRHNRHKQLNKYSKYRRGNWEVKKGWIPPRYKEVWNPGHYNPRGEWVDGHRIKIVAKPGYWTKKREWVASKKPKRRYGKRF